MRWTKWYTMTSHVIAYGSLELLFGMHTFNFNCFFEDFNAYLRKYAAYLGCWAALKWWIFLRWPIWYGWCKVGHRFFRCKIVNIFLLISFNMCFGDQKNRLIETVLLSTHNICFVWEIRKLFLIQHSYLTLDARKPVFRGLRTTKAQTSLRIRAVWSAP